MDLVKTLSFLNYVEDLLLACGFSLEQEHVKRIFNLHLLNDSYVSPSNKFKLGTNSNHLLCSQHSSS